ncbi:MAG: hypothetical protein CM1200mP31_4890 [Candidatus Neomarinimicrobiota bacterium]|nr:MAG: hypothetical protein CM1200mP31_4890 [Candidatus Neomarinimicrobiota bacterium]
MGKRNEEFQEINGKKLHYSDRKIIDSFYAIDILETQLFFRYFSDAIGKSDLLPVKGVSTDSRDIKKGDLFLANKGEILMDLNLLRKHFPVEQPMLLFNLAMKIIILSLLMMLYRLLARFVLNG